MAKTKQLSCKKCNTLVFTENIENDKNELCNHCGEKYEVIDVIFDLPKCDCCKNLTI